MKNFRIRFKKILCSLLIVCLAVTCSTSTFWAKESFDWSQWLDKEEVELEDNKTWEELTSVYSDSSFELRLNNQNGSFCVFDKVSNSYWWSNPQNWRDETTVSGSAKESENAQLIFSCYNQKDKQFVTVNSYTHSVKKGGYSWERIENGFRSVYKFAEYNMSVALDVRFDGEILNASVKTADITDTDDFRIHDMSMLPYFMASDVNDSGYMLIPDGSGAVIELNNGKTELNTYARNVYGESLNYSDSVISSKPQLLLPIMGLNKNSCGILALIEKGDALATVNATVSGQINMFNTVYPSFVMREYNYYDAGAYGSKDFDVFEKGKIKCDEYSISYHFLGKDAAEYDDMAILLRGLLQWQEPEKNYGSVIKVLAATRKVKSVLGVPVMRSQSMTDISQLSDMLGSLEKFTDDGIAVQYVGADTSELENKVFSKIKLDGSVGSLSELEELSQSQLKKGNKIYLSYNPITFNKSIFASKGKISIDLLGQYINVHSYTASGKVDDEAPSSVLLRPEKILSYSKEIAQTAGNLGFGFAPQVITNRLYTDFSGKNGRAENSEILSEALSVLGSSGGIMTNAAAGYALKNSEFNTDIPRSSSNSDLFDRSVPFYEIVMSGKIQYAYSPINLCSDIRTAFLKCLETAAVPQFALYSEDKIGLRDSADTDWYAGQFGDWKDTVKEYLKEYGEYSDDIGSGEIIHHSEIANGVYKTVFKDGCAVVVNYCESDFELDGNTVKSKDYLILKEVDAP